MRVSMRFAVAVLIVTVSMSSLALGVTGPVAAESPQRFLLLGGAGLPANLEMLVASIGGTLIYEFGEIGVAVAESSEPAFVYAAQSLPGIQAVVPDALASVGIEAAAGTISGEGAFEETLSGEAASGEVTFAAPVLHSSQWNLRAIRAREAWTTTGILGAGAVVAVVDSGIDASHPAFGLAPAGQVFAPPFSRSFVSEFADPNDAVMDKAEHGTHIAGIIAARAGTVGVAPRAKLVSIKVLKWNALARRAEGRESDILAAILYAANLMTPDGPVDIINISAGFTFTVNGREIAQQLAALNRAINYAHQKGIVVVTSIGNGGSNLNLNANEVKAPAEIPHVVAASATGPLTLGNTPLSGPDTFASFSDYGRAVYVAAPGGNVLVQGRQLLNNPMADWVPGPCSRQSAVHASCATSLPILSMAGTSQAAAHVSGVAALIVSRFGGTASAETVRAFLKASAVDLGKPGRDPQYGFGRIDALRAVTVSP
ncbi:MAG TPA: S8 family serine peptidase [bacterium]|nr:S8 family serine peptidase [bacterium]